MIEEIINYNTEIEELDLYVKTYKYLKLAGINTIGDFKAMIHSKEDFQKIRKFDINCIQDILNKLLENNIIEITSTGKIKYISEENLFLSEYGYKDVKEIDKDNEAYKKSIIKKFERFVELKILLQGKEELIKIDKQLEDETALLMSKLNSNEECKKKIKSKKINYK